MMGSVLRIVCVMVAMAGLASRVQANYHVSAVAYNGVPSYSVFKSCPSNYYNCECFGDDNDREGTVMRQRPPSLDNFFAITYLCGYKKLNHYHNNDGTYSVFVDGGDGKVVATCSGADKGKATITCPLGDQFSYIVYDHLVCYGHPCEP